MLKDRRYREIAGILLFLAGIILLLSLATYNKADYKALVYSRHVSNLIGPVGALLGHLARSAFGVSAYIFTVCLFIAAWAEIREGTVADITDKLFSLFFLTVTTSAFFAVTNSDIHQNGGGFIGFYIYQFFKSITGIVGAYLVIVIMNVVGFILLGTLSVTSVIEQSRARARKPELLNKLAEKIAGRRQGKLLPDEPLPMNSIDDSLKQKKKRPPWIEKKKVIVGAKKADAQPELKYIEMKIPESLNHFDRLAAVKETYTDMPASAYNISENDFGGKADFESPESADFDDFEVPVNREIYSEPLAGEPLDDPVFDEPGYSFDDEPQSRGPEKSAKKNRIFGIDTGDETQSAQAAQAKSHEGATAFVERKSLIKEEIAAEPDNDGPVFSELKINQDYIIPTSFLHNSEPVDTEAWEIEVRKNSQLLVRTLADFGIESKVINVNRGPVITLYEMQIAAGIKINRVVGLSDDIAMALAAYRVRIVAPIPGKSAVGVEIPNRKREMVTLGDVIKSRSYTEQKGSLKVGLGKDILGFPVTLDLKKQPHLLIAGATGAGKSVCVNSIITSIVYNYDPNYVRFILVDPKMVELQLYNGMPHLLTPVITEPHMTPSVLKWAIYEMERRYRLLASMNTRDIITYNEKIAKENKRGEKLPFIIIIIDELADLMMVASKEIEGYITRIAQKARAVGIHLVLATQRPSVDVITGIIKANFPARIAFQVAQKTDSRTIIDQNGAEKLLGKGDMLYQSPMSSYPVRIQGAFISEEEIEDVVKHLKIYGDPQFIDIEASIFEAEDNAEVDGDEDELFVEALKIVEDTRKASASYLQRRLSIGYNRAARMIEKMEELGYIGPQQGSKPRDIFI